MFKSSTSWGNTRYRRKDGWLDQLGLTSSGDRMINLRVTIDMSFRFRFALFLCAFIILVNVLFKVQTDIVDSTIYKQSRAAIYHPPSRDSDSAPQEMGRDLDGAYAPDLVNRGSERLARLMRNRRNRMKQAEEEESLRAENQPDHPLRQAEDSIAQQGSCRAGHIPGLGSICDSKGCLRKLNGPHKGSTAFRDEPLSEADRRNIDFLPGWLDPVHYDIIPLVTDIQWSEGLYGSVGELVAGVGKFTSLLTYNVDQSVGELLFVSDDFSGQNQQVIDSGDKSAYDTFVENISGCGYTVTEISATRDESVKNTGSKTIYVHKGSIMDLDKDLFRRWDMPQFRLIAVDASEDSNPVNLLSSLIISSCILTDGGVLVVNGVEQGAIVNHIIHCLSQYFNGIQLSPPVLVPLLSARNRLYLTTSGYRQLYTDHLVRKSSERLGSSLEQVTTTKYGRKFTYLTMGDE